MPVNKRECKFVIFWHSWKLELIYKVEMTVLTYAKSHDPYQQLLVYRGHFIMALVCKTVKYVYD